jgi:aspartyl-tRNA(Asn)/glutamyl-tRNA(Gln) amidotransferase subunit C
MLDPEDVRRVAALARLAVEPDEEKALIDDLVSILEHFAVLQDVDTEGVDPMRQPLDALGAPADDAVAPFDDPGDSLLPLTQHVRDAFFVVPRVIEHRNEAPEDR